MKLIDELTSEHALIERVLGSLRTYASRRANGAADTADAADAAGFLEFFRGFSGSFHHGREEDTLFSALTAHADLAPGSGPVRSLRDQHEAMARTLEEIAPLLERPALDAASGAALVDAVGRYSAALLTHIDAENSVLLPEAAERLRRSGISELPCRAPTTAEAAARESGARLAERWPATEDRDVIRGEGCAICPSYGVTCEGLEREWWTDSEWETFDERQG